MPNISSVFVSLVSPGRYIYAKLQSELKWKEYEGSWSNTPTRYEYWVLIQTIKYSVIIVNSS